jgi:hypothetical protein
MDDTRDLHLRISGTVENEIQKMLVILNEIRGLFSDDDSPWNAAVVGILRGKCARLHGELEDLKDYAKQTRRIDGGEISLDPTGGTESV